MSSDVQREIGERLASELPKLDAYVCGCDPNSVAVIDGTPWVHSFDWGWHNPTVQHPDTEYWPTNGETVLA